MVVVGSVYEKNKIIKDPDQEIYARHFDRSLIRKLSLSRFAQAAHQACCEPVKITAKFSSCFSRPLFIFYHIQKDYSWPTNHKLKFPIDTSLTSPFMITL